MQAQSEQKPLAVFNANGLRGLTLGIAWEDFGYDMRPATDQSEHAVVKFGRKGEPLGLKSIEFDQFGRYDAFDERIVDCMRRHPGNKDNGGEDFFEVPMHIAMHGAPTAATPQGGLSAEERADVAALQKFVAAATAQLPSIDHACEVVGYLAERCSVFNVPLPEKTQKLRVVQGKIEEFLQVLQEHHILEPPGEGRADS